MHYGTVADVQDFTVMRPAFPSKREPGRRNGMLSGGVFYTHWPLLGGALVRHQLGRPDVLVGEGLKGAPRDGGMAFEGGEAWESAVEDLRQLGADEWPNDREDMPHNVAERVFAAMYKKEA